MTLNWSNEISLNGEPFSIATAGITQRLNDGGVWHVWIDYDPVLKLLQVRLAESVIRPLNATLTARVDLAQVLESSSAYVGFSGAGFGAGNTHDVLS